MHTLEQDLLVKKLIYKSHDLGQYLILCAYVHDFVLHKFVRYVVHLAFQVFPKV